MPQKKQNNLSLHTICIQIAWAKAYAKEPLNESHPKWADYLAYSEWFRIKICRELNLPLNTVWERICYVVGCLNDDQYPSKQEMVSARRLGHDMEIQDDMSKPMFKEFEKIKFAIVGRY